MPRFMLYPTRAPGGPEADTRIEVGWQRGGQVVVAATKLRPGCEPINEYTSPDDQGDIYRAWDGEFIQVDRSQINQLIRELRRARDQAYGADQ